MFATYTAYFANRTNKKNEISLAPLRYQFKKKRKSERKNKPNQWEFVKETKS